MSESLVTVVRYEQYGNTSLLKSLTLGFDMKGTVGDEIVDFDKTNHFLDSIDNKINRIIKKINFCYHDGIKLDYSYGTSRIGGTTHEVLLDIKYNYEKNPNYYKLNVEGLLPCVPSYDKQQFEYALIHGFEPTLNMVKLVNI